MEFKNEIEAIHDIRRIMNRQTRFLSLSGLAGVFAGTYALIGAYAGYHMINVTNHIDHPHDLSVKERFLFEPHVMKFILIDALIVLLLSVVTGWFFTWKKAKKENAKIFDKTAKRALYNFAVPLATGGIFCLALLFWKSYVLLAPATLIFYGLAVFQVGKYTFDEVGYMGLIQIGLGLVGIFQPGYGFILWPIGFGVVHILYGIILWNKYDRKPA